MPRPPVWPSNTTLPPTSLLHSHHHSPLPSFCESIASSPSQRPHPVSLPFFDSIFSLAIDSLSSSCLPQAVSGGGTVASIHNPRSTCNDYATSTIAGTDRIFLSNCMRQPRAQRTPLRWVSSNITRLSTNPFKALQPGHPRLALDDSTLRDITSNSILSIIHDSNISEGFWSTKTVN
jgi:hypothetical protein